MIIEISVVPKSRGFRIVKKNSQLKVYLRSPPEGNKANLELIKEFEKLFGNPVKILSGAKSKKKKIQLPAPEAEWNEFLSEL